MTGIHRWFLLKLPETRRTQVRNWARLAEMSIPVEDCLTWADGDEDEDEDEDKQDGKARCEQRRGGFCRCMWVGVRFK